MFVSGVLFQDNVYHLHGIYKELFCHLRGQPGHQLSMFIILIPIVCRVQQQWQEKWCNAQNHLQRSWAQKLVSVDAFGPDNEKYDGNVGYQCKDNVQIPHMKQVVKFGFVNYKTGPRNQKLQNDNEVKNLFLTYRFNLCVAGLLTYDN